MKRIQKVLFALAAVVALVGADTALAQTRFQTTGGLRIVRAEGRTEVVNAIDLVAETGAVDIQEGTVITITYAGDITNNFTGDADSITPFDLIDCSSATLCAAVLAAGVTIDDNNLFIEIDDGDAVLAENIVVTADDRITVSGVRIDVAEAGPGDITATITSSGDPATHRVTYTDPVLLVARARVSYEVEIEASENNLLLCDPPEFPGFVVVVVKVSELFSSSFTTQTQEEDAGIETTAGVNINQGSEILFTFDGVNEELTIDAAITDASAAPFAPVLSPATVLLGDDDPEFTVDFTGTDLGATEDFEVTFTVYLDDGDDLTLEASTVELTVNLDPIGDFDEDDSEILLYADNGVTETVFQILECLSFLLYQWVPNTDDGAYDTGMVMSNTGNAPDELNTPASQTGPCHVHFYELDGGEEVAVVDTADLEPGESATMVVSQVINGPFLGYAIAVCEFQWGHGFWFTSNFSPGAPFAQGGEATVLTDRTGVATESRGQ